MLLATVSAVALAIAGSAPFWIAGWIVVLTLVIGGPIYYTRKRRRDNGPK
jgi:hypothetical protein